MILILGAIFLVTNQNKEEVSAKDYYKNVISQKQLQQGVLTHAHQAKILKYPQNENFISLHLFMRL